VVHSKSQTNVKPPEQQIHDSYFNHQIKYGLRPKRVTLIVGVTVINQPES
jgi:hypothetical protein